MASMETKKLDQIITSRRALLAGGGAALAALAMPPLAFGASTVTTYSDADILNFALNLEYLEANFYYGAAFGTTITTPNTASTAAGAPVLGITGVGTLGGVTIKSNSLVPFTLPAVKSYAIETAVEEGKHVAFLRTALGAAAVAQPAIDLMGSFNTLANAATIATTFDPFANDFNFLIGAYIFEDVGVTAYHGAASLLTTKSNLTAAAGILAVEAYHAGLVRTTIAINDPANTNMFLTYTQKISNLRATLSRSNAPTGTTVPPYTFPTGTYLDDTPLTLTGTQSLAGAAAVPVTTTVDADLTNVIAFSRNTAQVLNIVTGGGAQTPGTKSTGVFFPVGLNGLFT